MKEFPVQIGKELWYCIKLNDGTFLPISGPFMLSKDDELERLCIVTDEGVLKYLNLSALFSTQRVQKQLAGVETIRRRNEQH